MATTSAALNPFAVRQMGSTSIRSRVRQPQEGDPREAKYHGYIENFIARKDLDISDPKTVGAIRDAARLLSGYNPEAADTITDPLAVKEMKRAERLRKTGRHDESTSAVLNAMRLEETAPARLAAQIRDKKAAEAEMAKQEHWTKMREEGKWEGGVFNAAGGRPGMSEKDFAQAYNAENRPGTVTPGQATVAKRAATATANLARLTADLKRNAELRDKAQALIDDYTKKQGTVPVNVINELRALNEQADELRTAGAAAHNVIRAAEGAPVGTTFDKSATWGEFKGVNAASAAERNARWSDADFQAALRKEKARIQGKTPAAIAMEFGAQQASPGYGGERRGDRSDAQITRMALANLARQGFDVSRHVQGTGLAEVLKFAKSDNPEERGTAAALMSERPAGKPTLATEGAERLHQIAMAAYDLADKETNPDRAARLRQRGETMERARQKFEGDNGLPVRPLRSELVPEASETKRFVASASPGWQQGQQEWFKAVGRLRARQEAEAARPVEPTSGIPTKPIVTKPTTAKEQLMQKILESVGDETDPAKWPLEARAALGIRTERLNEKDRIIFGQVLKALTDPNADMRPEARKQAYLLWSDLHRRGVISPELFDAVPEHLDSETKGATPAPTTASTATPRASGDEPVIKDDSERDALPPGTIYVGPDGARRRKR